MLNCWLNKFYIFSALERTIYVLTSPIDSRESTITEYVRKQYMQQLKGRTDRKLEMHLHTFQHQNIFAVFMSTWISAYQASACAMMGMYGEETTLLARLSLMIYNDKKYDLCMRNFNSKMVLMEMCSWTE